MIFRLSDLGINTVSNNIIFSNYLLNDSKQLTARRLSLNKHRYGSYETYNHNRPHGYRPYSYNSEYQLYDDDPIPFHSRKNRLNYHRYRYRHNPGSNKLYGQYSKSYEGYGIKGSQHARPSVVGGPRVVFGPPIIQGENDV